MPYGASRFLGSGYSADTMLAMVCLSCPDDSAEFGDISTVSHSPTNTGGTQMRVARWVAAGIGLGACGGFVAGLLRSRSDTPWAGWQPAGEPSRYEPVASVGSIGDPAEVPGRGQ
jgi:hypothetical protein